MLVSFSVDNYTSFRNKSTFSVEVPSERLGKIVNDSSLIKSYNLFKTVAFYGANASGKSNFISAMGLMRSIVLNKIKVQQSTDTLPHYPYKFNTSTEDASTTFEIQLILNNKKYRYGFEYDAAFFYSEYLYEAEQYKTQKGKFKKEKELFYRDLDSFPAKLRVSKKNFSDGYTLQNSRLPDNQLFLWLCDREEVTLAKDILKWFSHNLQIISKDFPVRVAKDLADKFPNIKHYANKILQDANVYFTEISSREVTIDEKSYELISKIFAAQGLETEGKLSKSTEELFSQYKKYDEHDKLIDGQSVELDFDDESEGTKRFYGLIMPIIDAIIDGNVLLIDELEDNLHFQLIKNILDFIQSESNSSGQVIFSTHSGYILNFLDVSQAWGVERDRVKGSKLVSFNSYNTFYELREEFENGRVGAVPYIRPFSINLGQKDGEKKM